MPQLLTTEEKSLISTAAAKINSIPRFTAHRSPTDHICTSAVLSSSGRIFTGVNTTHFTGGPCAEIIAFGNATLAGVGSAFSPGTTALSAKEEVGEGREEKEEEGRGAGKAGEGLGERLIAVVAVLSDGRGIISPCGKCRQIMWDMHPWIRVIVPTDEGEGDEGLRTVGMDELLPYAYTWVWKPKVEGVVKV